MFHSDFIPDNTANPWYYLQYNQWYNPWYNQLFPVISLSLWRLLLSGFLVGRNEMNAAASLWKPPSEGCARGKADNRHRYFLLQTGKNKMAVLSYSPPVCIHTRVTVYTVSHTQSPVYVCETGKAVIEMTVVILIFISQSVTLPITSSRHLTPVCLWPIFIAFCFLFHYLCHCWHLLSLLPELWMTCFS